MEYVTVAGVDVPALGLGTWPMKGKECRRAVETALDLGYRHIDTAQLYGNEAAVGEAIRDSTVDRDDVFLVTKVHRDNLAYRDVLDSVQGSRERLGTHIDLLLIHSPSRRVPLEASIRAMNELQDDGLVSHIGVSNFSVTQLEEAIATSRTPIITNQVEYHPYARRDELLAFCIDEGIMLTAYSPVAKGRVAKDTLLQDIGDRHGKTATQVALRWLVQQDMVSAIPKSANPSRQAENIDIFDFVLSTDEMNQIFELQATLVDRLRARLGL